MASQQEHEVITLKKHQVAHFERMAAALRKQFVIMDTSNPGAGKSFTAMAIAIRFRLKVVIVCPKSMIETWKKETTKYNIEVVLCINYASWRTCKHGYITKKENVYYPTSKLTQLVQEKTLFIFDESHNLKNQATQSQRSCYVIIKELIKQNCGSRAVLLSATPFDKEEHICALLQMLGVVNEKNLVQLQEGNLPPIPTGILQVYHKCRKLSPQKSTQLIPHRITKESINNVAYTLYTQILKKVLVSSMPSPKIPKDAKNGFYNVNEEDLEILRRGEVALKKASSYRGSDGRVGEVSNWTAITNAIKLIGRGKLRTLIRLTLTDLQADPNMKIIIFAWYVDHINYLAEQLNEYNPLVLYGSVRTTEERDNICQKFQTMSAEHRLLIANPTVGGVGLSLDDQDGNWPRTTYMIPDYRIIVCSQAIGRTARANTKSLATIRFVYCKEFDGEKPILDALARKSEVIRSSLSENQVAEFPGDLEDDVEADDVDLSIIQNIPLLLKDDVFSFSGHSYYDDNKHIIDTATLIPKRSKNISGISIHPLLAAASENINQYESTNSSTTSILSTVSSLAEECSTNFVCQEDTDKIASQSNTHDIRSKFSLKKNPLPILTSLDSPLIKNTTFANEKDNLVLNSCVRKTYLPVMSKLTEAPAPGVSVTSIQEISTPHMLTLQICE